MQKFRIVFAPTAEADLDSILTWLKAEAPHSVEKWFEQLSRTIMSLERMPTRCRFAPENGLWGPEPIRQLLFTGFPSRYRILFTISKNEVRILNIHHGARRYLHEKQ